MLVFCFLSYPPHVKHCSARDYSHACINHAGTAPVTRIPMRAAVPPSPFPWERKEPSVSYSQGLRVLAFALLLLWSYPQPPSNRELPPPFRQLQFFFLGLLPQGRLLQFSPFFLFFFSLGYLSGFRRPSFGWGGCVFWLCFPPLACPDSGPMALRRPTFKRRSLTTPQTFVPSSLGPRFGEVGCFVFPL